MKKLFVLLIMFVFYSGTVNLGNDYFLTLGHWLYFTALLSVVFTFLYFYAHKKLEVKYNKFHVLLLFSFLLMNILAATINAEMNLLIFSFSFFIIFVTLNTIIPAILGENTITIINKVFIIVHVPIILIPLYIQGLKAFPYNGGFDNENSMGITGSIILIMIFSMILKRFEMYIVYNKINIFSTLLLSVFTMLLIVIVASTGSRTSFVTSVVVILIGLLLFIKNIWSELKNRRKLIVKIVSRVALCIPPIALVFSMINKLFPISYYIEESILSKFTRQAEQGRLLSGRENIWEQTIQDASLFGNGSDYFIDNIGKGAHNTFIHILGVYGWASIVLFTIIILVFGLNAYHFFNKKNNTDRYFPILIFIAFIGLSMAENLMHNIIIFLLFIYVGCISTKSLIIIKR